MFAFVVKSREFPVAEILSSSREFIRVARKKEWPEQFRRWAGRTACEPYTGEFEQHANRLRNKAAAKELRGENEVLNSVPLAERVIHACCERLRNHRKRQAVVCSSQFAISLLKSVSVPVVGCSKPRSSSNAVARSTSDGGLDFFNTFSQPTASRIARNAATLSQEDHTRCE